MNDVTKLVIRTVLIARNKGKETVGYVFRQCDREAEDQLEELGFYLDRFDMFITDISWENVDFTREEFSSCN